VYLFYESVDDSSNGFWMFGWNFVIGREVEFFNDGFGFFSLDFSLSWKVGVGSEEVEGVV